MCQLICDLLSVPFGVAADIFKFLHPLCPPLFGRLYGWSLETEHGISDIPFRVEHQRDLERIEREIADRGDPNTSTKGKL